jgi:DNA invertase Pin-like site-specific DNA recombinase/peptidoglycan hydrolase-like protein with peptidoglycan-binding domain
MSAITGALGARVRPAAVLLVGAIALSVLFAGSAAAETAYSAASAKPRPIPWTGWNGRPIERPQKPVDRGSLARATFPAGWSAGAVRYGTGYHRPGGSERVREVQRRLTMLGYHTGPIDGLYGPLTRSSVQWFQIKHGLRPTGVVAATTLATLTDPKGLTKHARAQAKTPRVPIAPHSQGAPATEPRPTEAPSWLERALLAGVLVVLVLGALTLVRLARRVRASENRQRRPGTASAENAAAPGEPARGAPVLGYVTSDDLQSAAAHEAAIRSACEHEGWTLARLIRDARAGKSRPLARPGLSYALEQLAGGRASRLVVHEFAHIARSMAELRMVLGWFLRTGIALTALDVGLDTGTEEGRTAARALLLVAGSEQAKTVARTQSGLAAARGGRPSVGDHPELASRIRDMRSSGMTLQSIADTLNGEGVPTVRGGRCWRPSSVQAVLGYKRSAAGGW